MKEIDWSKAPEWANYYTDDRTGDRFWWENKPQLGMEDSLEGYPKGAADKIIRDTKDTWMYSSKVEGRAEHVKISEPIIIERPKEDK